MACANATRSITRSLSLRDIDMRWLEPCHSLENLRFSISVFLILSCFVLRDAIEMNTSRPQRGTPTTNRCKGAKEAERGKSAEGATLRLGCERREERGTNRTEE